MAANHSRINGNLHLESNFYFCFDGNAYDEDYLEWELMVNEFFACNDIPPKLQARIVAFKLTDRAKAWWKHLQHARCLEGRRDIQTWSKMKKLLRAKFLSSEYVNEMEEEKIESNTTIEPSIEIRLQTKKSFHNFIDKEKSSSQLEFKEEGEARNGEEWENSIVDTGRSLVEVINQSQLYEMLAPLEGKVKKISMEIKKIKEMLTKNKPRESKLVLLDIQKKCYNKKDLISFINGFDIRMGDWTSIWKPVEEMLRRDVVSWHMMLFILSVRKMLSSGMWYDKVALDSSDSTSVSFDALKLLKWALEYIKIFLPVLSLRAMCGIFVVTVNGEIYNHEVLRTQLPTHKLRTGSDCEVITHLYEEYGENLIDMLDGVISFVLHDSWDNNFIAACDVIGVTPLYIGWGLDGSVWISSEMKGLHDECEHFELFPPGHLYSSKHGGFKRRCNPVWVSESIPPTPFDPLALKKAFEDAVIKRLMTDAPFWVLLSGGLDSSLVASVIARHLSGTKAVKQWGSADLGWCLLWTYAHYQEDTPEFLRGIQIFSAVYGNMDATISIEKSIAANPAYAEAYKNLLGILITLVVAHKSHHTIYF